MHLNQESLSTVNLIVTSGVGLCAFCIAFWFSRKEISSKTLGSWLMMTSFILFSQEVNFPTGLGFPSHFLGTALLTNIFGPWSAMLSIGLILTVQAVFLGVGSIATIGANFISMGIVATGTTYFVFYLMQGRRRMLKDAGQMLAMALSSYASVLVSALSLALIMDFALSTLISSYALVAFFEAFISVVIFYVCARYKYRKKSELEEQSLVLPILMFGLIAVILIYYNSQLPDALGKIMEMYTIGVG